MVLLNKKSSPVTYKRKFDTNLFVLTVHYKRSCRRKKRQKSKEYGAWIKLAGDDKPGRPMYVQQLRYKACIAFWDFLTA